MMDEERVRDIWERARDGFTTLPDDVEWLIAALRAERARANDLEVLFDLQHTRTVEADKLWREAHPGNENIRPDLGKLIEWLLESLREERQARQEALLIIFEANKRLEAAEARTRSLCLQLSDGTLEMMVDERLGRTNVEIIRRKRDAALAAWEQTREGTR